PVVVRRRRPTPAPQLKAPRRFARSLRLVADHLPEVARSDVSPAAVLWLAAIGALAFRWASPLGGLVENAILADLLIGAAALLFAVDLLRGRVRIRWQPWHLWLAGYVAWIALAGLAAI